MQLESAYNFKHRCTQIYDKSLESDQIESCSLKSETREDFDEEMIVYESEYVDDVHYSNTEMQQPLLSIEDDEMTIAYGAYEIICANPIDATYTPREETTELETTSQQQAEQPFSSDDSFIRNWQHMSENMQQENINEIESNLAELIYEETAVEQVQVEPCDDLADDEQKRTVKNRKSYSSGQKLDVVKCAEVTGNRQAAKIFSIDESCIRKWRLNKQLLIEIHQERGTKRKPNLHWPELDMELKGWVKDQMNCGRNLKPAEIKAKSIEIANALNLTTFKGTSSYIFKFMERYRIPGRPAKNPVRREALQAE